MSRDKQIEEMAKDMCEYYYEGTCYQDKKPCDCKCDIFTDAQYLYAKGYRKASEVAREMVEMLTNFFSNDEITRDCEVDAEYINEQIGRIANELMEGKRC